MDPWFHLSRHVLFPLQCRRERSDIPRSLRDLESSQWWTAAALTELKLRRLKAVLVHANTSSPYWRKAFAVAGLQPQTIHDLSDLQRLPTLSKRDLQQHRTEMRAPGHHGRLIADKTGGSTGEPVKFDLDERRFYYRNAVAMRHNIWAGWQLGCKSAFFWGHRADAKTPSRRLARLRTTLLDRQIFLDTSSLSVAAMTAFQTQLLAFDPAIYIGYANAVYLYAQFLQKRGGRYHRPRGIITSAEFLAPEQRAVIESVFGCRVFDRYGSRETGLVASECGEGDAMHVADESILVEILRADGTPAAPGERGRVVVTDLLNFGMPLLRYEIRDTASPVSGACPCGRGLSRLRMAGGRVTDFLLARDGRIVSGASLTIYLIANARGIAHAQLVQETRSAIRVRVVPGEGYDRSTAEWILGELPGYFGTDMEFTVEEVADIPLAASGKHQFSVSTLDPTELF